MYRNTEGVTRIARHGRRCLTLWFSRFVPNTRGTVAGLQGLVDGLRIGHLVSPAQWLATDKEIASWLEDVKQYQQSLSIMFN